MKKVLVTGASGFIGSTLIDRLLALGNYEVYAGVRAKSSRKYLQDSRIKFIDLALSDPTALKQQLDREQFDCIFHFKSSLSCCVIIDSAIEIKSL